MGTFKVLTWNVENLFSPVPSAKLQLIASVIVSQNPHVVALQEVGGQEPLKELMDELAALGNPYGHAAISNNPDKRGIRVALISRLPLHSIRDFIQFPDGAATRIFEYDKNGAIVQVGTMGRGALAASVQANGMDITVATAHLKSKLLSFPRPYGSAFSTDDEGERAQAAGIALSKRMAEAVTIRYFANELLEKNGTTPLIVLGDFNDVSDAQTSLLICGPSGSQIGTKGFDAPDAKDDVRLWNLAACIPQERRFSRIEQGRKELLDQIFASEELFPRGSDGHRKIPLADSLIDFAETGAAIESVGTDPGTRKKSVAPDHAPVVAEFEI